MPLPAPPLGAEVTEVYTRNFEPEILRLRLALESAALVSIDCEFPGVCFPAHGSTPAEKYEAARKNVDCTRLLQLGICVRDLDGQPKSRTAAWNFNFALNKSCDWFNDDSLAFLEREAGFEFENRTEAHGYLTMEATSEAFRHALHGRTDCHVVVFAGKYDLLYLLRLLSGGACPRSLTEFYSQLRLAFPGGVSDVRCLLNTRASLANCAKAACLTRLGTAHTAGSDAVLTMDLFLAAEAGELTSVPTPGSTPATTPARTPAATPAPPLKRGTPLRSTPLRPAKPVDSLCPTSASDTEAEDSGPGTPVQRPPPCTPATLFRGMPTPRARRPTYITVDELLTLQDSGETMMQSEIVRAQREAMFASPQREGDAGGNAIRMAQAQAAWSRGEAVTDLQAAAPAGMLTLNHHHQHHPHHSGYRPGMLYGADAMSGLGAGGLGGMGGAPGMAAGMQGGMGGMVMAPGMYPAPVPLMPGMEMYSMDPMAGAWGSDGYAAEMGGYPGAWGY